jgi:hypothetical protein
MKLLLCIIAAEAMVQLICKAEVFDRPREWVKSLSGFTESLLNCAYCVSVWIAAFTTVLFILWDYSFYFIYLMVIHRLSNFFHDGFRVVQHKKINMVLQRGK